MPKMFRRRNRDAPARADGGMRHAMQEADAGAEGGWVVKE